MNSSGKLGRIRVSGVAHIGGERLRAVFAACTLQLAAAISLFAQTNVVTQHNDIGRTGQNLTETILTPANVNKDHFGKLFTLDVDGQVLAQPLYLSSVTINGAVHPVVFVETEHDSVYAFDAAVGTPLWQASMLDASHRACAPACAPAVPVPISDTPGCYDVCNGEGKCEQFGPVGEYGITGTPVIDASRGTLYVVSNTFESGKAVQRLHALDITTGNDKLLSPVVIQGSTFNPKFQNQRAGILEVSGNIYVAFASHCDGPPYHGWILGYNAATLVQTAKFVTTPNGMAGGIWMSGTGLAAETFGGASRIFPVTGNGVFDANLPPPNNVDYGDSVLSLAVASNGALRVADTFTPQNQQHLSDTDSDLGSGGALLLPDQPGPNPHLLVVIGKEPVLYLLNRDKLGGYSPPTTPPTVPPDKIVQEVAVTGGLFGTPAYWNGSLYVWPGNGLLSRYTLANGQLGNSHGAPKPAETFQGVLTGDKGATPSISANGVKDGIVWSVPWAKPQVVYANDASNVSQKLWSSDQNPVFDSAGSDQKFVVPTIADGHVFIAAVNQVQVYGLIPPLAVTVPTDSLFFGPYGWSFPINLTDLPNETVDIANGASGPLTMINIALSGRNPDQFFTYGGCEFLPPGKGCELTVVFNPKTKGKFNAMLMVTASSGDGSVKVAAVSLTGTSLGPKAGPLKTNADRR